MKHLTKNLLTKALLFVAIITIAFSCDKDSDSRVKLPIVSFESSQITINTDSGKYDLKLRLSSAAPSNFTVKVDISGTAVENEHFTVVSKEISVAQGATEAIYPITILNDNIWDNNLTIKVTIAPSTSYVVDPQLSSQIEIKMTKEIVLPVISFSDNTTIHSNPFNAEELTFTLSSSEALKSNTEIIIESESDLKIGDDFLINGGNNNRVTIDKDSNTKEFKVTINKKDIGGFDKELKLKLTPADPKRAAISQDKGSVIIEVIDPLVDLSPMLKTSALLGGEGFQIYQQIKGTDDSWIGRTSLNANSNTEKKNYLKTYKNRFFISAFDCNANTAGGDVLRLADMLSFETSDTVIADYGAGKTSRFFSPTDSLMRFVAEGKNIQKGVVTSPRQKFTANLILKADWETGTNTNKQWHIDSKATGGDITKSTVPTFHTMEIWLEKLEGTYDFSGDEPEIIFTAWYKSSSPYFMRIIPSNLDVRKDGDMYKVTYRYYPR